HRPGPGQVWRSSWRAGIDHHHPGRSQCRRGRGHGIPVRRGQVRVDPARQPGRAADRRGLDATWYPGAGTPDRSEAGDPFTEAETRTLTASWDDGPGGLDRGQRQERLSDRLRYRRDRPRGRSILTVTTRLTGTPSGDHVVASSEGAPY